MNMKHVVIGIAIAATISAGQLGQLKERMEKLIDEREGQIVDVLIDRLLVHVDLPTAKAIMVGFAEDLGMDTALINHPKATDLEKSRAFFGRMKLDQAWVDSTMADMEENGWPASEGEGEGEGE